MEDHPRRRLEQRYALPKPRPPRLSIRASPFTIFEPGLPRYLSYWEDADLGNIDDIVKEKCQQLLKSNE